MKKAGVGSIIGIIAVVILVVLFRVGVAVKNILYPPKVEPPTMAYDKLTPLAFPKDAVGSSLTYTLNTLTGELPEFPDRLNVYPTVLHEPNFLNLDKAKTKAGLLGFVTDEGNPIPELALGEANYEWIEQTGINRKLIFNIVTFDFTLSSDYRSSLVALRRQHLSNQKTAISTAKAFLDTISLFPEDINLDKTQTPEKGINYTTYPQLFSIDPNTGALSPSTSLADAQVIRVDFYQKDLEYQLNTGIPGETGTQLLDMKLPILYPRPPYSTMSFWIASGDSGPEVVESSYVHQDIAPPDPEGIEGTYPIKTAEEAFEELKNGEGYIAAYSGTDTSILINNVYLAYYFGETKQNYLMPIIVFEGDGGFFGYVSAVENDWIE